MNSTDFPTNDDRVSATLGTTLSRRSMMKGLAGAGAAALALRTLAPALAHHTEQTYTVSANANFRSGPGTNYSILGVISKGATFKINGQVQNTYAGVIYGGKTGWVLASLVVEAGSAGGGSPTITGQAWTTSAVNLRTGPGTSHAVLKVVPAGSVIGTSTTVQNGFRFVKAGTASGWVSDAYLAPYNPGPSAGDTPIITGQSVTTSAANLRSGPGTSYSVLKVVPAGSMIGHSETVQDGFRYVSHNGVGGWMSNAYTGYGGTGAGPESGYFTTTSSVNFRTEPTTSSSIIQVLPKGTKVEPLPTVPVNDFFNVTYNGKTGWVASAYLQT